MSQLLSFENAHGRYLIQVDQILFVRDENRKAGGLQVVTDSAPALRVQLRNGDVLWLPHTLETVRNALEHLHRNPMTAVFDL